MGSIMIPNANLTSNVMVTKTFWQKPTSALKEGERYLIPKLSFSLDIQWSMNLSLWALITDGLGAIVKKKKGKLQPECQDIGGKEQ